MGNNVFFIYLKIDFFVIFEALISYSVAINELIYKMNLFTKQIELQIQRTKLHLPRGKGRGISWEVRIETHT